MSDLQEPTQGMIFFSLLCDPKVSKEELRREFHSWGIWGEQSFDFNPMTEYYSKEMGDDLVRWFWIGDIVTRDVLVDAKIWACELEKKYSKESARTVNCDPGLICPEHMLLATGKSYAHRIYLNKGIYAELTYIFSDGAYKSLQWTYPDYAHEDKRELFKWLRSRLLNKIHQKI